MGVLAALAATVYAVLWVAYAMQWSWLQAVDDAALRPFYDYCIKHPAWVRFWDVLCAVFSPSTFRLVGAGVVVAAIFRRNLRVILFVVTAIGLSGVVTQVAKDLTDRPRPSTALTEAASTAFPSGHAVGLMTGVLALLTISAGLLGRHGRPTTVALGAAVVLAVGVGRVILNLHHPSDVLAGWALGYLWYLACLLAVAPDAEPIGESADETPQAPGIGS